LFSSLACAQAAMRAEWEIGAGSSVDVNSDIKRSAGARPTEPCNKLFHKVVAQAVTAADPGGEDINFKF